MNIKIQIFCPVLLDYGLSELWFVYQSGIFSQQFYGSSYKFHMLVRINLLVHFFSQLNLQSVWRWILPVSIFVEYSGLNAHYLLTMDKTSRHTFYFSVLCQEGSTASSFFSWLWALLIHRIATRGHGDPWTWLPSCVLHILALILTR